MVEGTLSRPTYVDTLLKALETEVPRAEVRAEQVRGNRYRFFVVSERFDPLGHPERQEQVWDIAARVLDKSTLRQVTMILTLGLDDLPREENADGVEADPMTETWENCHLPDRYKPGVVVEGRVTAIHSFGAFLELEPRVFALLLVPEISDVPRTRPDEVLSVGQRVRVKVIYVDGEQKKISVSLKRGIGESAEPDLASRSERIDCEPGCMTADRLRECLTRQPFKPFSICTVDRRKAHVPAREFALLPPGRERTIIVAMPREGFEIISIEWITGIEFGSPDPAEEPAPR